MHTYSFEKLDVWKEANQLAIFVYKITNQYPNEEKFGLISQMRRCSVSVSSNIAEGTSRLTKKDKAHFMTIAYSSAIELLNQAIISYELKFISEDHYNSIRLNIESITNKINALRNHFLK
ncbi:four helix bundle protein [Winogradskyella immobilis]|uniref:Four helix bundle protein n=1 Tax=Winogradskyella immobilis TaxID=2816852 RepID=A0ABS8EMI9_9FLAO|nr:four helix bundle protein [Winogradskyella immobilis]MCC1484433.1 four helix bundle protein [Winogradskyella immobilis]MCG0016525.1 four helix bundle protein [Winogradskyella immobilis]